MIKTVIIPKKDRKIKSLYDFYVRVGEQLELEVDDSTIFNPKAVIISHALFLKVIKGMEETYAVAYAEASGNTITVDRAKQTAGVQTMANAVYLQYGPSVDLENKLKLSTYEIKVDTDKLIIKEEDI